MRTKGQLAPHTWLSGPDPVDHKLYTDCQKARAQAWFRKEEWEITEREYIDLWRKDDLYLNRGRAKENVCMTRVDTEKPWSVDNVQIVSRLEHYRQCQQRNQEYMNAQRKKQYAQSRLGSA